VRAETHTNRDRKMDLRTNNLLTDEVRAQFEELEGATERATSSSNLTNEQLLYLVSVYAVEMWDSCQGCEGRFVRAFAVWWELCAELWRRAEQQYVTIKCARCSATFDDFKELGEHVSTVHPDLHHERFQYQESHTKRVILMRKALGLTTKRTEERRKSIAYRSGPRAGLAFLKALQKGVSREEAILDGLMADLWIRGEIEPKDKGRTDKLTPLAKATAMAVYERIVRDIGDPIAKLWLPALDGRLGLLAEGVVEMSVRTTMKRGKPLEAIIDTPKLTPAQWASGINDADKLIEHGEDEREQRSYFSLRVAFENERRALDLAKAAAEADGPTSRKIVQLYGEGMIKAEIHREIDVSRPTIDARLEQVSKSARQLQKIV
jgi:phage FluMu protein Com